MLPRLLGEDVHLEYALGDLKKTRADAAQIEQLLMNLAGNARDAMPHGGELKIQTSMVQLDEQYVQQHPVMTPGEYILLTVSDSGEGIAPEHLPHIFEPFYTTKKENGTGLGLWLAYGIVQKHTGWIRVASRTIGNSGTVFMVFLPESPAIAASQAA
jgi:signal transduction histidine kinase